MQWLRSLVARAPRRATLLGKALFLAGGILVLAALFARIGLVSINGERAQAGLATLHSLAEAYPQYPTWIVPEGPVGFGVAALLVIAGMVVIALAEKAR
jgi:hypothetical protein